MCIRDSAYTANTSNNITGAPVAQGNYVTSSPGVLTGNLGYKMYLSNAIYSFYAVSCNSTSPAPTFTNGLSEPLSNGVDYLWWHAVHQDIASSQINIPITYQHASSCSDRRRRKYHFKQDTFRYHPPTETGRNHGFVNRYHHFGSQL